MIHYKISCDWCGESRALSPEERASLAEVPKGWAFVIERRPAMVDKEWHICEMCGLKLDGIKTVHSVVTVT